MEPSNTPEKKAACLNCSGLMWWTKLLVAVLAVPAVGILVGSMVPMGDLGKTIVFVITCWIATWLGMKLMKNSNLL